MPIKKKWDVQGTKAVLRMVAVVKEMPVKDDGGTVNSQKNPGRKHFWELSVSQGLAWAGFMDSVFK